MTTQETPVEHHVNGQTDAGGPPTTRDDTTRYLCAAAHLDEQFANEAIREFLVESTRPVPPSAGVDTAAVLGEAVAARTRRKLRDIGLLVLLAGLLFVAPPELLAVWLALAVALYLPAMVRTLRQFGLNARPALYLTGGAVVLALIVILWPQLEEIISTAANEIDSSSGFATVTARTRTEVIVDIVLTVLGAAGLLIVLLADRIVVWKHFTERFWPNRRDARLARTRDRALFQYSPETFLTQLSRFVSPRDTIAGPRPHESAVDGTPASVLVYRSYVPFVGAGVPQDPWSIAVPLEPLPDADDAVTLTTDLLYAGIRREIESLRDAGSLAPGRRLRQLGISEQVVVCADELIDHLDDETADDFLERTGVAPYSLLRPERVRSIRAEPVEWARYYQCYQVETWDRDMVMSVYVHVAVGTDTLYVEWTPCLLTPIRRRYRDIDTMSRSLWRPLLGSVGDLLRLPASVPARLMHTFSLIRPAKQPAGVVNPDSYGVAVSLRELAAAPGVDNYFQLTDIERYLKVMEGRLVLAVSRMLRSAGYSQASFEAQAATVVNNNVTIGGSVGGHFVAGNRNKVGTD